ncbi:TIGR00730 family Rossman fold protein [Leucobacter chinensis]|uniref:LOG family protein n=1 Tax=Leucobacter chinensis TaxID=2851010 RepID=UPI001C24881F|nr:TIGR00730 family Rossman fold protein [Leucobacter chinensis]
MSQTPENEAVQQKIDELIEVAGITENQALIRSIVSTGIGLGEDGADRLNLKITSAAVEEMRNAFRLFAPHRGEHKVTIFGSARTQREDPLWLLAEEVATKMAEHDWFVVTGAGPGIMEAASHGAGEQHALGVSIRLPFEESPNMVIAADDRQVSMKYFFTRKLMLVKESRGFVCLPGGFGTMDELFELLTLQQTGKMIPVPIVLVDHPDGTFWSRFKTYIEQELDAAGMISPNDLDRVLITSDADAAADEITGFWRNYDSLRWFGTELVLRLRAEPTDEEVASLNEQFAHLIADGSFEKTTARPAEVRDNDVPEAPRLVFTPAQRRIGELHRIIRALNALESAPQRAAKPSQ